MPTVAIGTDSWPLVSRRSRSMYVNLRESREVFDVGVSDFLPATGAALAGSREAKAASGAA
jgi:hypothetical protein